MRRIALFSVLALHCFLTEAAHSKPCITNIPAGQNGLTMQSFRSHSAKLGKGDAKPECSTNGKDKELKALKEYVKGLYVIGMPGYNNENRPNNYMDSLERFVTENGGHFVPMATHSDRMIEVDADRKCKLFRNVAGKRVVMIGHSKGGATALSMWQFCAPMMNQFEAVILVQAVIQGTKAADDAVNANMVTKQAAEWVQKYPLAAKMVGPASGGASMTTANAKARLAALKGKVNTNKVICVRSKASYAEMPGRVIDIPYAQKAFGSTPNDGLVEFAHQHSGQVCGHDIQLNGVHHKALIERDSVDPADNDARESFAAFILNKARQVSGR